jgi:CRISPR/Cas system CMR subunit Cmr4 (Cas7 group RAMP superfamily)
MQLRILLKSDTSFGRGDGIAGLIDSEIEHDSSTGFPIIKGRTLKGLMVESCADILYALEIGQNPAFGIYFSAAAKLFGVPGSTLEDTGCLHIGEHMPQLTLNVKRLWIVSPSCAVRLRSIQ